MPTIADIVVNLDTAPAEPDQSGPWGGSWTVLTPRMRELGGTLGMVQMRLPPGCTTRPFHWHAREDEVFFVVNPKIPAFSTCGRPGRRANLLCPWQDCAEFAENLLL